MTLTLLADALDEVGDRGLDTAALQTIFVTVDAERDTPEQLAAYLSLFDTEVTGLTGSSEALVKVQRDFGAYASRVARDDGVVLGTMATVYLYDADGRFTEQSCSTSRRNRDRKAGAPVSGRVTHSHRRRHIQQEKPFEINLCNAAL